MSEEGLKTRILTDLTALGLPVYEVNLILRPYSKTYYGRYYPVVNEEGKARVVIYPYDLSGGFMDYSIIIGTSIHEMCHHKQYTSGCFVRRKGVMHDTEFWKLYNHYMIKAYRLGIAQKRGDFSAAI